MRITDVGRGQRPVLAWRCRTTDRSTMRGVDLAQLGLCQEIAGVCRVDCGRAETTSCWRTAATMRAEQQQEDADNKPRMYVDGGGHGVLSPLCHVMSCVVIMLCHVTMSHALTALTSCAVSQQRSAAAPNASFTERCSA